MLRLLIVPVALVLLVLGSSGCGGASPEPATGAGVETANVPSETEGTAASIATEVPTGEPTTEASGEATPPAGSFIPGMAAVDVYGNMESKGFKCDSTVGAEGGMSWLCKDESGTYSQTVEILGDGPMEIQYVSAASLLYGDGDPTEFARDFLAYVASLPYQGASPTDASAWVRANVGENEVSTTIGGVTFTLHGKERARILDIKAEGAP